MAKKQQPRTTPLTGRTQASQSVALNLDAPTAAKQNRRQRITTWAVWLNTFVLVPLLGLTGVLYLSDKFGTDDSARQLSSQEVNSAAGKATATLAMQKWLAAKPEPLPDGRVISWDGYVDREAPPLPADAPQGTQRPEYLEQMHHFTLTDGKRLYDSDVLVHVDDVYGAKAIGTPTLLPRPAYNSGGWGGEVDWFGFDTGTDTTGADTAVQSWVDAFISGSPKKLKQSVGDPSKEHAYVPLSDVSSAEFTITTTATKTPASKDDPKPKWMIARVQLDITWDGQKEPEPGEQVSSATYDVLIVGTNTATPKVVSWGGPGTGPELKKYSVALSGVTLREPGENDNSNEGDLGLTSTSGVGSPGDGEGDEPEQGDSSGSSENGEKKSSEKKADKKAEKQTPTSKPKSGGDTKDKKGGE